jgi:DNA-binding IclR family transcriptional regulator
LEAYLNGVELTPFTPKTVSSTSALRAEILAGRERGWFLNDEQSLEGVITLSAPFAWSTAVYIVTIAGPKNRLEPKLDQAAQQLLAACRSLEMRPPPK